MPLPLCAQNVKRHFQDDVLGLYSGSGSNPQAGIELMPNEGETRQLFAFFRGKSGQSMPTDASVQDPIMRFLASKATTQAATLRRIPGHKWYR